MQTLINILVFLLILTGIIVIHELGHLIAAKFFKVYCGAFSIGMGPKIFGKKGKETEFQIAYQKGTELFLAKGYGRQMSGGYSIQVKELSASSNAVFFETKLIGPTEKIQGGEPSYPYIVIKTEYRDGPVQFQ